MNELGLNDVHVAWVVLIVSLISFVLLLNKAFQLHSEQFYLVPVLVPTVKRNKKKHTGVHWRDVKNTDDFVRCLAVERLQAKALKNNITSSDLYTWDDQINDQAKLVREELPLAFPDTSKPIESVRTALTRYRLDRALCTVESGWYTGSKDSASVSKPVIPDHLEKIEWYFWSSIVVLVLSVCSVIYLWLSPEFTRSTLI